MDRSPTFSIGLAVLLFIGAAQGTAGADASRITVAQGEIRIPSDADLERLERQGMATPPLEAGRQTTRQPGAAMSEQRREEIENQQMDRQDRAIDQKVLRGICRDC
jgi:hypothetical protein